MKRIFASALVALGLSLATGGALATTTLPKVTVVGTTIDQFNLACTGYECTSFLESIGGVPPGWHTPVAGMGESGGFGQVDLTKAQFCNQLSSPRPSGFNPQSPPSVPVYDPMWEPNGCGTGGLEEIFYKLLMGSLYDDHFSGSLDAPTKTSNGQNISFLGACNHHDKCWASAGDRGTCDQDFYTEMMTACGAATGADLNACQGIAGIYRGAVSSDSATDHYDDTVDAHACAAWAYDMRRNGCA
jgi:hypothetical protein